MEEITAALSHGDDARVVGGHHGGKGHHLGVAAFDHQMIVTIGDLAQRGATSIGEFDFDVEEALLILGGELSRDTGFSHVAVVIGGVRGNVQLET